jgi:hypothetical protein
LPIYSFFGLGGVLTARGTASSWRRAVSSGPCFSSDSDISIALSYGQEPAPRKSQGTLEGERLPLPLSSGGVVVDKILGAAFLAPGPA